MSERISGRCLCGDVAYEAEPPSRSIDACHCTSCRRWSGHFWASVNVELASLRFLRGEERVTWFESSELVRRGFCSRCGSSLFWHPHRHAKHAHTIAVSAGSVDAPTGLRLTAHIFTEEQGDYYALADDVPKRAKF